MTQSCPRPAPPPAPTVAHASPVPAFPREMVHARRRGDGNGAPLEAEGACAGSQSLRERLGSPPPASLSRSLL